MAAAGLPEAAEAILPDLARAVSLQRRGGGALDALPARQQELLHAMATAPGLHVQRGGTRVPGGR